MGVQKIQLIMAENQARKVVVAMDGSECANFAFDWYMKHVFRKGDEVICVHIPEFQSIVQSPMIMADVTVISNLYQEEDKRVKKLLEEIGENMKKHGTGGKVKSISGNPGEVITEVAKNENASLIVTGTRGMGTIRRTLLGSVSDYVIHHAHIPVLVCRQKHHHQKQQEQMQE